MSPSLVSLEAEQSVLGGLLLDNAAVDRIPSLQAQHFASENHRRLYAAIVGELAAGRPVDAVTLRERMRAIGHDDDGYIDALAVAVPSSAHIARHAQLVADRAKARELLALGSRAVEIAQDQSTPIDERVEQMQAEIGRLADKAAQREATPLHELLIRHSGVLQERAEGKGRVFATGLSDVDRVLGGGLRPGNLAIVAARPAMGKTAFAMTVGLHMAQTLGVGFLSMEMSESELGDRITALLGRTDMRHLQRPQDADPVMWDRVMDAADAGQSRRMWLDDQGGLTIHQASAKARAMRRRHGIDVLIVDYLQLMSGTDAKQPRAYQLEEISRGLKALAKSLGIAVLALAQVNRRVEGGMPGLADLKDSGAIEQDADLVAFIHRPIAVDPSLGAEWKHYAQLRVAKNRQGPTADVHLSYQGEQTRFGLWSGSAPIREHRKRGEL